MLYFSAQTAIDLERIKIVDMSREDKNLLPAIHNFRTVLAFLDAGQNGIFYKLWDAGLGDCDVWLGEALTPDGKPIRPCKLPGVLRHDLTGPAAVLIQNPAARNTARIGLNNVAIVENARPETLSGLPVPTYPLLWQPAIWKAKFRICLRSTPGCDSLFTRWS